MRVGRGGTADDGSSALGEPTPPGQRSLALGRIPFRVRVGVSGHRVLENESALAAVVGEALDRIAARVPATAETAVVFTVVSPLAEGADRLVARQVLDLPGAELEVLLPMPRSAYETDFATAESRRDFAVLLAGARLIIEAPASKTREEAYQRVGNHLVERCDVLVVLWDGQPARGQGGTAEVVERARGAHLPLFWIQTGGQHELREERADAIATDAFDDAQHYNAASIDTERFEREVSAQSAALCGEIEGGPFLAAACSDWVLPYFVRADMLALRNQRLYYLLGDALFIFAGLAVVVAVANATLWREAWWLKWTEVVLLAASVGAYAVGRHLRVHGRWIAYRFLAERFRSAFYLALAGLGDRREGGFGFGAASQDWIRRGFTEVWNQRPVVAPDDQVPGLRQLLADSWIGGQARYHRKTADIQRRKHQGVNRQIFVLLAITASAALARSMDLVGEAPNGGFSWGELFAFVSISAPAVGAAITGRSEQREYRRHHERHELMALELERIGAEMERAPDVPLVQAHADQAEKVMLEENQDWFGVVRFHDFELHV